MMNNESEFVQALPPEPKKRKSSSRIPLIAIGVFSSLMLLCCGFCGFAIRDGVAEDAEMVRAAIETDETLLAEIGSIESIAFSWGDSFNTGNGVKVFDVSGTKGSGQLHADMLGPFLVSVELKKEGQSWDLIIIPEDDPRLNQVVLDAIQTSPALEKKIGPVQTAKVDWRPTQQLAEEEGDDDLYVVQVSGEKGTAEVVARIDLLDDRVIWAKLRDGEEEMIYKSPQRSRSK
ncbi:hypothetical protein LOC68_28105 [Blastopirellula sp. JC732]|uniref:Uncharacterized protein n=1 Tax=Blastopirellula sediminis TaxID=2894196 RepID=A0A9X1SIG4_9BACT|nr:hypothetical protein [Blastopirellula sediminis]MCC9604426.1 hypothetical protein [Blastopirellula sediminis]MCC9632275.1 hypothetical protein [Blastopirellula sediminis]